MDSRGGLESLLEGKMGNTRGNPESDGCGVWSILLEENEQVQRELSLIIIQLDPYGLGSVNIIPLIVLFIFINIITIRSPLFSIIQYFMH